MVRQDQPREWRRQSSPIQMAIVKEITIMKREKNKVSGNRETRPARGTIFIKSRRSTGNAPETVNRIKETARKNGVETKYVYRDNSDSYDYDRPERKAFLEFLQNKDVQVIVIRSLNEITDDMAKLERFIRTVNDMGIWIYCLAIGPVPVTVSHAEDFGC